MNQPIRLAHLAGQPAPSVLPLYRILAADPRVELMVYYGSSEGVRPHDGGYGTPIAWDMDLLSGYESVFLRAADRTPGLGTHFFAARNWDIVPTLLRERYDALWMAGYYSATYVIAAAAQRATGGAVLFREEQTTLDRRSLANTIAKQLLVRPYLGVGWGLYISHENRRWLESFGMPNDRLFPAPYSVDNAELTREADRLAPERAALRESFGIAPEAGPVIVTVSRLIDKKQPLMLLEAFRRVREQHRCVLLIVGTGPLEAAIRDRVRDDAIPDVVLPGFMNRSEITRAYAAADIFALTSSYQETFGLVVNEAMNFGLPVVVSDRVGSSTDLVSTGYNGFVIDPVGPDDTVAAISALVTDPDLRDRMGAASRARIASWGPQQAAEGIIAAATAAVAARRA